MTEGPSSANKRKMRGPTPYAEVNRILLHLLVEVQKVLRGKLVGLYLYGSLSLGNFDPDSSDVDFLVVTTEALSERELSELKDMHVGIAGCGLPYARRLEGSYIPAKALRRYDPDNDSHPTVGADWEFGIRKHGSTWIIERHIVREHGVTVLGPPPATLIDAMPTEDLRKAVSKMLDGFWREQIEGPEEPEWLRPRDYQAFAVLTMCRALHTLSTGNIVSKPQAAEWALTALDPKWTPLIERSLAWRREHTKDDLAETLAFVRFAVEQGRVLH